MNFTIPATRYTHMILLAASWRGMIAGVSGHDPKQLSEALAVFWCPESLRPFARIFRTGPQQF